MNVRLGLIGAGGIARKHLDVIRDMDGVEAVGVTSRTPAKSAELAQEYGIGISAPDIATLVKEAKPDALLVLVSFEHMYRVASQAVPHGLPVFIEKPPGLRPEETARLVDLAHEYKVPNMVGYNRRYYSLFRKGKEIIHQHGGLLGIRIEGHERFWQIADSLLPEVREQWIYANNTHMIDLIRFFGGEPAKVSAAERSLHEKNGDQFAALLEFHSGVIGQYNAHWYSPGGWGVVLYGNGVTVEFKPLEKGWWVDRDFQTHAIIPDQQDIDYKPGFYSQMEAFIRMVRNGVLDEPGQDLESAYKTMCLARRISQPHSK